MSHNHPIRSFRKNHQPALSQAELGEKIGVTRFTIMRWENGSPIDIELLPNVTRETGIPAKDLRPDLAEQFQ